MGFFVILLAMNMGPKVTPRQGGEPDKDDGTTVNNKAMDAIISIRDAFHSPLNPNDPADAAIIRYKLLRDSGRAEDPGIPGSFRNVQALENAHYKNVTGSVPFDDRSSLLSPTARQVVTEVAAKQRDQRWILEVRGHVSPFESMRDNIKAMKLSNERALVVAQALVEAGVKWENLRIVACGSNERVVPRPNERTADRGNQRVEIVVTNETIAADPYAPEAGTPLGEGSTPAPAPTEVEGPGDK